MCLSLPTAYPSSVTCDELFTAYLTECYTVLPPEVVYTYSDTASNAVVANLGILVTITTAEQQAFITSLTG